MLLVLGPVVGDGEPGRLGADEYVLGRTNSRVVSESSHGDMDKGALADDGIVERSANPAMGVVAVSVAEDHELVFARGDGELVAAAFFFIGACQRLRIRGELPPIHECDFKIATGEGRSWRVLADGQ